MRFSPPQKQLAEVLQYLRKKGFIPTGNKAGVRTFEGNLSCRNETIKVKLAISDWDFVKFPEITVIEKPEGFPSLAPHIANDGWLCYFAAGSVILDRYDPAESVAQCIDQAQIVLEEIRFNPDFRQQHIQNEFLINWLRGQSTTIWPVLIGTVNTSSPKSDYWLIKTKDNTYTVIANDTREVQAIATALGGETPKETKCPCWLLETNIMPNAPDSMPSNVTELFGWLSNWDVNLYKSVQRVLEKEKSYLEFSFITFAIKSPVGWIGFGFDLESDHRLAFKGKPSLYKQYLHKNGHSKGILRLVIYEFGPDYVHSRNLTFESLKDKRITLVGCGAIGSQVASGLVRLGAGSGKGSLELIDYGAMESDNLGRHYLGYPSIFLSKVQALSDELIRQFPMANIKISEKNVRDINDLFDADIVIDATGEEALSEMLNGWRLEIESPTPTLHVRIRGNGESVQTFWAEGKAEGCFRCLLVPSGHDYRQERYKLLKNKPVLKQLGCSPFTPYAISAPLSAAALCLETIVDWLKSGSPNPRFRTRSTSNGKVFEVSDQNIKKLKDCPACGK